MTTATKKALPSDLDSESKIRVLRKIKERDRLRHRVALRDWRTSPRYWRCDRPGCDGSPHVGRHHCEHPLAGPHGEGCGHARRIPGRSQVAPETDWRIRYLQGGRGSGKGYGASNTFADLVLGSEPGEWACVGPTFSDARDVMMQGPSGLIRALGGQPGVGGVLVARGPWIKRWNVSTGQLFLNNGSLIYSDGAGDGALRIQGKNLRGAWCDEIGLWAHGNPKAKTPMWKLSWDESIKYAVRLAPSKIVASGTPKANRSARELVRRLIDDPKVPVDVLWTEDNLANLLPEQVEEWMMAEGTRLGQQELRGVLLSDVEGALVTWDDIIPFRVEPENVPALRRVLVTYDPSFSTAENADESGIAAVAEGEDHHAYVLEDRSGRLGLDRGSKTAVRLAWDVQANAIVYEGNMTGEVVRDHLLAAINDLTTNPDAWEDIGGRPDGWHAPRLIRATARLPKEGRLEVIAPLYQQHRVHHCRPFDVLETQITTWVPGESGYSPDRMDAVVQGLAELGVHRPPRGRRTTMGEAVSRATGGAG